MSIEWWQVILGFLGTNGITYYCAKPKKRSLEIENLRKIIDEAQEERENMKALYSDYERKNDQRMKELEEELESLKSKYNMVVRATNIAYRCPLPKQIADCPVIRNLEQDSREIDCKI